MARLGTTLQYRTHHLVLAGRSQGRAERTGSGRPRRRQKVYIIYYYVHVHMYIIRDIYITMAMHMCTQTMQMCTNVLRVLTRMTISSQSMGEKNENNTKCDVILLFFSLVY